MAGGWLPRIEDDYRSLSVLHAYHLSRPKKLGPSDMLISILMVVLVATFIASLVASEWPSRANARAGEPEKSNLLAAAKLDHLTRSTSRLLKMVDAMKVEHEQR